MGFRKFRLTGGEPLVRRDVPELIRDMRDTPGVQRIGLSTNGTRLAPLAKTLRKAGLSTVNISLDAIDPQVYRQVTGGQVEDVLAGIIAALDAGFDCVKLNAVLLRDVNEDQLWPLVLFAAQHRLPLRLIELMPLSQSREVTQTAFLSAVEVMDLLRRREALIPVPDARLGYGPAKYYRLEQTGALVGFIGALTSRHFCDTCNRMRLTADGKVRPCLGNHGEIDLRAMLRARGPDADVAALLREALQQKPAQHDFCGEYQPMRPMTAIGG
jgi:cyclic pyranopterin phosphate synthase